ncbi:hypothetical protein GINT2_000963 [Glugoides intestinalis]
MDYVAYEIEDLLFRHRNVIEEEGCLSPANKEENASMIKIPEEKLCFRLPSRDMVEATYTELKELTDKVNEYSCIEFVENRGDTEDNQPCKGEEESDTVKYSPKFWFLNELNGGGFD